MLSLQVLLLNIGHRLLVRSITGMSVMALRDVITP